MFVPGSAELLVVGVLNLIAADLRVSIPAAGTLVTAYALGLAIGGPVVPPERMGRAIATVVMVPSLQYRVISLAGPGGQLARSLPASAANVGTVVVAWATGFLKPPAVEEPRPTAQPAPEPA